METTYTVLDLNVRNTPGAPSRVVNLCTRRDYPLEGVNYGPAQSGSTVRMKLLMRSDQVHQAVRQLANLHDTVTVRVCPPNEECEEMFV